MCDQKENSPHNINTLASCWEERKISGSIPVSGQLPIYPSPTVTQEQSIDNKSGLMLG